MGKDSEDGDVAIVPERGALLSVKEYDAGPVPVGGMAVEFVGKAPEGELPDPLYTPPVML